MRGLRAWSGWNKTVSKFEECGFRRIGDFARIASEVCGGRFSAEAFQQEQCEQGQQYVGRIFGERLRPARGPLRAQLQQVLAQAAENERLAKFEQPLYSLCEAEISPTDDGFEIVSKKDMRGYAERVGSEIGFAVDRNLTKRRVSKSFEGWLRGIVTVDLGGTDRVPLESVDLLFSVEVDESVQPNSASIRLGGVAEAIQFYQLVSPPRSMKTPPPVRDSRANSRMAKHSVRAQLFFFDLLMADLAENWRVER